MFLSTRSNLKTVSSKAIIKGLSDDGGLYVFDQLDQSFFNESLLSKSYQELSILLFQSLLDDFSKSDIQKVVQDSYNEINFPKHVTKIQSFENHSYLELFHGNTFAFKDMALSVLPNLLKKAKEIQQQTNKTIILTATSGDTGSAALNGFSSLEDTYVIVLYPTKGVSAFQEMQMNAFQSEHHIIVAVDGNFDDCQNIVKELFHTVTPNNVSLSSANSINIGRIIPQIVYYIDSYLELVRTNKIRFGESINVTVPTGNFGNIYAAYIAKKCGTPIDKLIVASNSNSVLTDLFIKNTYDTNRTLHQTISPSMDILISSNVERYLFELYNRNSLQVKKVMDALKNLGSVEIPLLHNSLDFVAFSASEEETSQEIRNTFETEQYLIDPHTAVARCVSKKYVEVTKDTKHMLIVSTANPYKFSDAIVRALGLNKKDSITNTFLEIESNTNTPIDSRMKQVLSSNNQKIEVKKEEAFDFVKKVIGEIDDQN